jgi:hypothetical protein
MSIYRRISNLFMRSTVEREIDAELRAHIEMRTEDNIALRLACRRRRRGAMRGFASAMLR